MTDAFNRLICSHPQVDVARPKWVSWVYKNDIVFVLNASLRLPKYL